MKVPSPSPPPPQLFARLSVLSRFPPLLQTNMADDRSPRRRKRTFSTASTISSDDRHDASEQIVEDVTLDFFYRPRSISALVCLLAYLVYSAFTRFVNINLNLFHHIAKLFQTGLNAFFQ